MGCHYRERIVYCAEYFRKSLFFNGKVGIMSQFSSVWGQF